MNAFCFFPIKMFVNLKKKHNFTLFKNILNRSGYAENLF